MTNERQLTKETNNEVSVPAVAKLDKSTAQGAAKREEDVARRREEEKAVAEEEARAAAPADEVASANAPAEAPADVPVEEEPPVGDAATLEATVEEGAAHEPVDMPAPEVTPTVEEIAEAAVDVPTEAIPRAAGSAGDVGAAGGGLESPVPAEESAEPAQGTDMDGEDDDGDGEENREEAVPGGESDGYDELRERFGVGTRWSMADAFAVLSVHGKVLVFTVSDPVKFGGTPR